MQQSTITFTITLDHNNVPDTITWQSADGEQVTADHVAQALNISIWDAQEQGTMKIGLWTKQMPVSALKRFCVDTIGALGDTLSQATSDEVMVGEIKALAARLLEHITPKSE